MNIAITGGGTGGHLVIAKAIKEELNTRGIKPIFIGSTYGQDRSWFEKDDGFEKCYFFETSGVVNKKFIGRISSLLKILKSSWQCRKIFKNHKVDAVFSVGGYSAAPSSFASLVFSKKLYIHEQNAVLGRLNKMLSSRAEAIFSSYLEESPCKDYPVREIFFKNARVRKEIKTIIFLGGSQGATAINEFAMRIASKLNQRDIKIIHQCGKRDEDKLKEFYIKNSIKVDLFAFSNDLESKIKEADFAICRAGASTLWELCASKLPALYIPYPYAAADHQYHNANFLAQQNLSFVKREAELKDEDLESIFGLDLTDMSVGLGELIDTNGAKSIVDFIILR
jgi:UDP-N-acetylglucosamine--N-acetylmuramyl-(pentapeptide) pyrophosphoryl-undecaprenol N-acetylglucosamine transferase